MTKKYSGVVVPMVTPVDENKLIDQNAVRKLVKNFAANGIHPLVLGTTGESSSVSTSESIKLVKAAVEARSEDQLIYAGLVGNQVEELVIRGNEYIALGADAVVATLPAYYILTPDQMYRFFIYLADHVKGPVLLYNIKATTQMSIPLEIVEKLSHHPNIFGLKDSERDQERMQKCIMTYRNREDFSYFCGWGAQSYGSLKLGADGIVPSTGNTVPEMYGTMISAAHRGDWNLCGKMQAETDLVAQQYQAGRTLGESLAVLKSMMKKQGLCLNYMLPPLTEVEI